MALTRGFNHTSSNRLFVLAALDDCVFCANTAARCSFEPRQVHAATLPLGSGVDDGLNVLWGAFSVTTPICAASFNSQRSAMASRFCPPKLSRKSSLTREINVELARACAPQNKEQERQRNQALSQPAPTSAHFSVAGQQKKWTPKYNPVFADAHGMLHEYFDRRVYPK